MATVSDINGMNVAAESITSALPGSSETHLKEEPDFPSSRRSSVAQPSSPSSLPLPLPSTNTDIDIDIDTETSSTTAMPLQVENETSILDTDSSLSSSGSPTLSALSVSSSKSSVKSSRTFYSFDAQALRQRISSATQDANLLRQRVSQSVTSAAQSTIHPEPCILNTKLISSSNSSPKHYHRNSTYSSTTPHQDSNTSTLTSSSSSSGTTSRTASTGATSSSSSSSFSSSISVPSSSQNDASCNKFKYQSLNLQSLPVNRPLTPSTPESKQQQDASIASQDHPHHCSHPNDHMNNIIAKQGLNQNQKQSQPAASSTDSNKGKEKKGTGESKSNASASDNSEFFECNICFETAHEPVVTLCGHLYCWPCLHAWFNVASYGQPLLCPVCKSGTGRDKVIPVYARGNNASNDPRTSSTGSKVPPRPSPQRPEPDHSQNGPMPNMRFTHANGPGFQFHAGFGVFPGLGFSFTQSASSGPGPTNGNAPPGGENNPDYAQIQVHSMMSTIFFIFGLFILFNIVFP